MKKLIVALFFFVLGITHAQRLVIEMNNSSEEVMAKGVWVNSALRDRPIREGQPMLPPAGAPEKENELKYVPEHGVMVRKGALVYKVANQGVSPIDLPNIAHKVGRIVYVNTAGQQHFYEGVENGKWIQIDNSSTTIIQNGYIIPNPKEFIVDYEAGQLSFDVLSNKSWILSTIQNGYTANPTSAGTNNVSTVIPVTVTYPMNSNKTSRTTTVNIKENPSTYLNINGVVTIKQLYKPYFAHSNIIDVHGKEQSGSIPAKYAGKVNPGPERFFAWMSSPQKIRMRIKYNGAAPAGGYAQVDAINGNYDYEFEGKGEEWAYEYQIKENRTGADRRISLEVSFQKMNGTWAPWEEVLTKNSNNSFITQSFVQDYATKKWSERYAGASAISTDVGYIYNNSAYIAQYGTEFTDTQNWQTQNNEVHNNHAIVTSYAEAGAGNGAGTWKLPTDDDLLELKTVAFIPNRPFRLSSTSGSMRGIASLSTYSNWSVSKTTFLDPNVVSENKIGYGNAAYLYDKTQKLIWLPENGMKIRTGSSAGLVTRYDNGVYISGRTISNTGKYENVSGPTNTYDQYIQCRANNNSNTLLEEKPERHETHRGRILSNSPEVVTFRLISTIPTTIDKKTNYIFNSWSASGFERKCTKTEWCGQTFIPGPVELVSCTNWQPQNWYSSVIEENYRTYRLVHD